MGYLGNGLSVADLTKTALRYERFSGNGSTTNFTLSQAVFTNTDLEVFVENVQQEPVIAFTASGTTLSFTEAPPSGTNNIYVVYRSYAVPFVSIADGSITNAKLAQNIKIFTADNYRANGTGNTYVLSDVPADANTIYVSIDGVVQRAPENYTLSGNTITFTSTPSNGSNVHVRHLGIRTTTSVFEPLAGSIGTTAIADGAITSGKLASSALTTINGLNAQVFNANGTFTIPDNVTKVKATVVGGGGSGGGKASACSTDTAPGGGAGGAAIKWLTGLTPGLTLNVVIGSGGVGQAGVGRSGNTSTVSSGTQSITTISATGGSGGAAGDGGTEQAGAAGGVGSGGDINIAGGAGGSTGGATNIILPSGFGGASIFGGGGAPRVTNGTGNAGVTPGSGGAGAYSTTSQSGGNGAAGIVVFEW